MKHILLTLFILGLSACGSDTKENVQVPDDIPSVSDGSEKLAGAEGFAFQNVRFDAIDYYEGEQITVTEGTSFEVQWVSPSPASYKIDLYLSTNGAVHSDSNKITGLKCGNTTFSLCPNATGEVQCGIDDNRLSCSVGSDSLGSEVFQEKDLSNLKFIIRGCDATLNGCDVKTFDLLVKK
jgi:hypothetical protein